MRVIERLRPGNHLAAMVVGSALAVMVAASSQAVADGQISGELKQWHKVTLTIEGPRASETDTDPNPFTDYRMDVQFVHESGEPAYTVPGYFAADGAAGESSATAGNRWRAHLAPDKPGRWDYTVSFLKGKGVALADEPKGETVKPADGIAGSFAIEPTDKQGRDFRAVGRLEYVGNHHLRFAGTGQYFLKAGPDSPESLLAYTDFDGTAIGSMPRAAREGEATQAKSLKTWEPHVKDWREGDPTWKDGKGKGLIGALNYLASKGVNVFSFLTYNAGGDGDNVWPMVARGDTLHYDCSKLDQWGTVFDHATTQGLYLHFKMQEQENDDDREGVKGDAKSVAMALDGGDLGPARRLYCRELIARFGHALALNWNLGEENSQSTEQQMAMARYIQAVDPYDHLIAVHTFPNWQDRVYPGLLGTDSPFTGTSLQNSWSQAHQRTLKWVKASDEAGKPWVVANDEQNPASMGVPPDPGYEGHSGEGIQDDKPYTMHHIRKFCLWGNLMAGGAGVEYYFGYKLPQNDLVCEDFRSRDQSWDFCRIALEFFQDNAIPFWEMSSHDPLVGNARSENGNFCLASPGEVYLVYLPEGGPAELDLSDAEGRFSLTWFNPRAGGELQTGSVASIEGGARRSLGDPPADAAADWLAVIRRP